MRADDTLLIGIDGGATEAKSHLTAALNMLMTKVGHSAKNKSKSHSGSTLSAKKLK